jgi:hypothetical protein
MSQTAKDLGPPPQTEKTDRQADQLGWTALQESFTSWRTDSPDRRSTSRPARRARPRRPRALALRRDRAGGGSTGQFTADELKQMKAAPRRPTAPASRRSRNTTTSRREAARGQGHLQLQADGGSHGPLRDQRLGRLEPDHLRQQRLQAGQGVEDAGRQGLQGRARADRRSDRDARRLRRRQPPRRLGDARHAAALPRGAAQGLARHAARLPAGRLVERRRRHRRPRHIKTMADLRGKTVVLAQNSPSHFFVLNALINAGVQPAEVEFKFTQDAFQAAAAFNADKRSPASSAGRPTSTTSRRSRATRCW